MGKSSTGKDTIYKKITEKIDIEEYVSYTTRPMRDEEKDGREYHFISEDKMNMYKQQGSMIECRTYQTVHGPWMYATINDEQFHKTGNMITVGTLESYQKIKKYLDENKTNIRLYPIYLQISEELRRDRAIQRENKQKNPDFKEMERRLEADNIDFADENLKKCGINEKNTFLNIDLSECVTYIEEYIKKFQL